MCHLSYAQKLKKLYGEKCNAYQVLVGQETVTELIVGFPIIMEHSPSVFLEHL
jgi:RNase H-fold protein (predicted Holliday junction resolvase)